MAILFHCPHCSASIRVPDSAAGKQGKCPQCVMRVIVPQVSPPAGPSPAASPPAGEFPEIAAEAPILTEGPPVARTVRKRPKRQGLNLLIPLVLFAVVVGVLIYVMREPGESLEGRLIGTRLTNFTIPPALIPKSSFEIPGDDLTVTWERMRRLPPAGIRIPKAYEMHFKPEPEGLEIRIHKTTATEVFRVETGADPAIRAFLKQHRSEILKRQQAEFRTALKKFFADWQTFYESNTRLETEAYRGPLGFNALAGPLGYCVEVKAGSRTYRCVHEDDNGDVYFLLPRKTKNFLLQGRELSDGKTLFPGRFTVDVQSEEMIEDSTDTPEPPAEEILSEPAEDMPAPETNRRDED